MPKSEKKTIAVLGATSQIAKDMVSLSLKSEDKYDFLLYSRDKHAVSGFFTSQGISHVLPTYALDCYGDHEHDAVINCIGAGDPARVKAMNDGIVEVTAFYDNLVLDYLKSNPAVMYIFLSSGAVYFAPFDRPVDESVPVNFNVNDIKSTEYYGLSKLIAEIRHRSLTDLAIVDLRLFNYFSRSSNLESKFFLTEVLYALKHGKVFETSSRDIKRDFIAPVDLWNLIDKVIQSGPLNTAIDCYSSAPVSKFELLRFFEKYANLQLKVKIQENSLGPTGDKPLYFSESRRAAALGFEPTSTSLENVIREFEHLGKPFDTVW